VATDIVIKALLERHAMSQPAREFAVFPAHDDLRWSWREADQAANAAACFLGQAGIGRHDAVGLLLDAGPDYLRFAFGALKLGAVIAPLNPALVGNTLAHAVNLSRARVLVCGAACLVRLEPDAVPHLEVIVVSGTPDPAQALRLGRRWTVIAADTVPLQQARPPDVEPVRYWDPYAIICTSGTTGPSKGVLSPYGQLHACVEDNLLAWMTPDDVYLLDAPLFHVTGLVGLYASLTVGARLVVMPRFDADGYWSRVRRYGVTATAFVLAVLDRLYRQPTEPDDADNPLRLLLSGPLPSYTRDWQQRFGVDVVFSYYNMTEIAPPIVTGQNPACDGSTGRLRPGYQARIVDDHDEELPDGAVGQLIVRSDRPWRFSLGYVGMPEATVEAWRNGWFHTGDMFRRNASGDYYFVDRQRDSIRRKGENISSFEVEREILTHPGVLECAVVGVPDPQSGGSGSGGSQSGGSGSGETEVKAVVVAAPGCLLDPGEVFGYLAARLPRFMVPRYIEIVAALPRNAVGRVTKSDLRSAGVTDATWDRRRDQGGRTVDAAVRHDHLHGWRGSRGDRDPEQAGFAQRVQPADVR
jgi:carnitine-CoA ligase